MCNWCDFLQYFNLKTEILAHFMTSWNWIAVHIIVISTNPHEKINFSKVLPHDKCQDAKQCKRFDFCAFLQKNWNFSFPQFSEIGIFDMLLMGLHGNAL